VAATLGAPRWGAVAQLPWWAGLRPAKRAPRQRLGPAIRNLLHPLRFWPWKMSRGAIIAYIDGGSRGNPGPAGFGVRIETPDEALVEELHESIGVATNNVAEYRGLLAALTWALEHGHRRLHVRSDSLLLVRQMRGEYRVKNPGLQALYRHARALADRFERVGFEHVPRSRNQDADRLANLAMDEAKCGTSGLQPGSRCGTSGLQPGSKRQNALPFEDDSGER